MADVITIPGVPPSADLRAQYAGQPMLLSFSRGKDSIAAWLAMREAGIEVIPFHLYRVPDVAFVEESIAYFEDWFDTRILQLPHPALWRQLRALTYQPPERCAVIEAADLAPISYDEVDAAVREHYRLPGDTLVADGVRAADNPNRRTAVIKSGALNTARRKIRIIWDWRKHHVYDAITAAGIQLPVDYQWFGRSFDGLDHRFLGPLAEHAPDDLAQVLAWFPLADLDAFRRTLRKPLVI
jgi:hypothetical protein